MTITIPSEKVDEILRSHDLTTGRVAVIIKLVNADLDDVIYCDERFPDTPVIVAAK